MRTELRLLALVVTFGVIFQPLSSGAQETKGKAGAGAVGAAAAESGDGASSSTGAEASTDGAAAAGATAPASGATSGAEASPCAVVSCSGHGACVLREGQPMCACDPGYAPDSKTGLSCIAIAPQPVVAQPVPAGPTPEQAKATEEMNAAVESVATVLSPRQARTYYYRYKSLHRNNVFPGTFQEYLVKKYTSKRNAGIAFTVVGACLISGSISLGIVSSNVFYDDEELGAVLAVFSVITGASGLTFLSIGIANTAVGGSKARRLQKLSSSPPPAAEPAVGRLRLAPFVTRTAHESGPATTYGLTGSFTF